MNNKNNIFKISIVVFMTMLLFFQSLEKLAVVSYYELFKEQLTEKYCVNIDAPSKMCNAKCYISSFLTNNQSDSSPHQISPTNQNSLPYIIVEITPFECLDVLASINHQFTYTFNVPEDFYSTIYSPPEV